MTHEPALEEDVLGAALLSRLRAPATWSGPPERLRLRILAAARAEQSGRATERVTQPFPARPSVAGAPTPDLG